MLGLAGWWWLTRPVPVLAQAQFSDLPGWRDANLDPALAAFRRSCAVIAKKPPAEAMADYAGTAADWQKVCGEEAGNARVFFEKNFTPYALSGQGLFTGYYEPEIRGSRIQTGAYRTPVYGVPSDLIRVDLSQFSPQFKGEHISGRLSGQKLVPYATRADINAKGLPAAKILFWCDDPVALFFLQIQGSGRVKFEDGSSARIAYGGENGRPYTAIGRVLLAKGELEKEKISLATIRGWLKTHPALAQGVMEANQSFIFFEEKMLGDTALGSNGVQGVPLTRMGSMAIDLRKNALGAPYYIAADPVKALLIAQDTGGAIRGQVRGDVYFGFGGTAEQRAGDMKAQGRMFVLLPNAVAARLGKNFFP
ncbi:MAG: murein transglycosylase A [Alphaproteobacteria bacterium]|nr:murein transglycosylase A [Alphaproteobacteria bacterium]